MTWLNGQSATARGGLVIACVCGLALVHAAQALEAPTEGAAAPPRVTLPVSLNAASRLAAAERLIAEQRWERALPMLQALIDEDGDALVPDGPSYVAAADAASRRLAGLPPPARRAYELLYGPEAARLYEEGMRARSLAHLQDAADRFANTSAGRRAASAAASLLMDGGDFGAALGALDSVADADLPEDLAGAVAAKKLLCLARLGRHAELERLAASLARTGPARLTIAGATRPTADYAAELLRGAPEPPHPPAAVWQSLGGNAAGNAARPAHRAERLIPLGVKLPWPGRVGSRWGRPPSTRPVADADTVFVSRDGAVIAVDRATRRRRWAAAPPPFDLVPMGMVAERVLDAGGMLSGLLPITGLHHWRTFDNHGMATLSVADGRLFAVQMDPARQWLTDTPWEARIEEIEVANQLRCYDAESGALLWRVGGGLRTSPAALRRCWFCTAPTVSGGRAYVLAVRRGRLRALCLDAETGALVWDSLVGTFAARQEAQRFATELFLSDTSPPAVGDGLVIFPTGQGAVCAFRAHDGRRVWSAPYARAARRVPRLGLSLTVPAGSWLPTQPVLDGGACLLTPMDSRRLLALSLRTGQALWDAEFDRGVALLGVQEAAAYIQHGGLTRLDVRTGQPVWTLAQTAPWVGVGALGRNVVLVPERAGVRRVDPATGADQGLMRWPPGFRSPGNLLLLGDALLACSPERIAFCVPPEAALAEAVGAAAEGPASWRARLRSGLLHAWSGQAEHAAGELGEALELARAAGNGEASAANGALAVAGRAVALGLAALPDGTAVQGLLTSALDVARPDPPLRSAVATARLRWALLGPEPEGAAALYFDLCRRDGAVEVEGDHARGSLWTELADLTRQELADLTRQELAGLVRSRPAQDQRVEAPWRQSVDSLIAEAAAAGDAEALRDVARWAPFPSGQAGALVALGRMPRADGRALAPEALVHVPEPQAAWMEGGLLVLPVGAASDAMRGKALIVEQGRLKCVDAAGGERLWAARLPVRARALSGHVGPGYPAVAAAPGEALVALPSALMRLDLQDGRKAWEQTFPRARANAVTGPVHRLILIQRAQSGLPAPSWDTAFRTLWAGGFGAGPSLACRAEANGSATLVFPDGRRLALSRPSPRGAAAAGTMAVVGTTAVAGPKPCLIAHDPAALEVYDPSDGELLARWRMPHSPGISSLALTPGGLLALADYDGVLAFDLVRMRVAGRWLVDAGVDALLYADDETGVLRTLDGRGAALEWATGKCTALPGLAERAPVWAARSGDVLYVLAADEVRRVEPYGPERHAVGSGFALVALSASDGRLLWEHDWPQEGAVVMGPPVRSGPLWLLRASNDRGIRLTGVAAATGEPAFSVRIPRAGQPAPVAVLVTADRLLVGAGDRVAGFAPSRVTVEAALRRAHERSGGPALPH